jgi:hypothetical protein
MFAIEYANAQLPTNNSIDVNGIYISDKQAIYQVKQINNTVSILGSAESSNASDTIANIFSGTLDDKFNNITGKWISYPLSNDMKSGDITFDLLIDNLKENITISKISSTTESNNFYPVNTLTRYNPAIHDPLIFYVSNENISIDIPRSPTSDTLYVGISGQKNDDTPLTATKYLSSRADGSNITTDLRIGPFSINNQNDTLKVNLMGLDKEDGTASFTLISLRNVLNQLTEQSYNITNLVQGTNIISSLSPALTPRGCNGLVFLDNLQISSETLRNLTAITGEYNQEKTYTGTTSPPGCGPPSQYVVKLSINTHE